MEQKGALHGVSLPVPNVQELAKEPLTRVPSRYIRPNQDSPIISSLPSSRPQVPVIDMERLSSQDYVHLEVEKLHLACREWGFFQLINHGVSCSLLEKLKEETQEFFNLPLEEKQKYGQKPGDLEGFGQAFVVSEEQKLDWSDMFGIVTLPSHLRKPHLLPKLSHPFRLGPHTHICLCVNIYIHISRLLYVVLHLLYFLCLELVINIRALRRFKNKHDAMVITMLHK
ncbi:putative thebaine 6-O-demethylase [Helianthus annuus]|uniref:Putative non-heme dioxygenase N-terminal domain, Isopenicillin N synthase-like protein n=1 Tax=Helianthus annuus TaxID=4232 RepID=A0A251UCX6_HELAN|nr:putative thebaine 6-O-demethylase [Helianthus annuus]KAJ0556340.1 putative thebaine 6-O-demethylase [Helianthus annuus]KAJ0904314.1 putative thebaine 6-O-demethylase [Helianthus annuus]KAJ0907555.1 putative thebaine 6-O-demethylase [Helianthus annuus]